MKAGSTINFIEGRVIPGVGFKWADLFEKRYIEIPNVLAITVPSPIYSIGFMTLFGFCYLILVRFTRDFFHCMI